MKRRVIGSHTTNAKLNSYAMYDLPLLLFFLKEVDIYDGKKNCINS